MFTCACVHIYIYKYTSSAPHHIYIYIFLFCHAVHICKHTYIYIYIYDGFKIPCANVYLKMRLPGKLPEPCVLEQVPFRATVNACLIRPPPSPLSPSGDGGGRKGEERERERLPATSVAGSVGRNQNCRFGMKARTPIQTSDDASFETRPL